MAAVLWLGSRDGGWPVAGDSLRPAHPPMVVHGAARSRLKDCWDLLMLPRTLEFDGVDARRSDSNEPWIASRVWATTTLNRPLNRSRWRALLRKGALTAAS